MKILAVLLLLLATLGCSREAKFSAECSATPPDYAVTCMITNKGNADGQICFDAVLKCSGGDHASKVCSGRIARVGVEAQKGAAFDPPVRVHERCFDFDIRNKVAKAF
jgi:hypothetical protein